MLMVEVFAPPPPPMRPGLLPKRIWGKSDLKPRFVEVKLAKAPEVLLRLEKTSSGVPLPLRVRLIVDAPEPRISVPRVWVMTAALSAPLKLKVPPFIDTAGRLPAVPNRSAL